MKKIQHFFQPNLIFSSSPLSLSLTHFLLSLSLSLSLIHRAAEGGRAEQQRLGGGRGGRRRERSGLDCAT